MNRQRIHQQTMPGTPIALISIASCLTVGGLLWYGPIPQDPSYHRFADQRMLLSVPHFWNVISNLPFILVGGLGLIKSHTLINHPQRTGSSICYFLFFTGVLLTGLSSAYYHLQPANWGLFLDRLTMALSFMALLSLIVSEFVNPKLGKQLLPPLVCFGLFSVACWFLTEQAGLGDLRLYVITQFLPMAIIPIIVLFWESEAFSTEDILIIGAAYGLAKVFEALDPQFYHTATVSGHSLKHLAAAFSAYWIVVIIDRQRPTVPFNQ